MPQAQPEPSASKIRPEVLALDAQTALLPYALVAFAVGVPLLGFAAAEARNASWLAICLVQATFNWAIFYGAVSWLRKSPARRFDLRRRTAIHLGAGLTWTVALGQLALVAHGAGPAREALLLAALCGAVTCFFFTAPHLLSLLIVGPLAAGPALLLLRLDPESHAIFNLAQGGAALAFALALIVNRLLRQSFDMAVERETLTEDRARALRQAEALAADKSDILATLSLEVRSGLSGVVHVLAAAAGPATRARPSRDQLSAALDAAQDLMAMVDATLDSERAEAGRLTVTSQPLSPAEVARDVVQSLQPLAASKGLMLTVECPADAGAVVADPARTRQILVNLVGNAVKYTLRGGVAVRVTPVSADRLRFEVADTGPGLAPGELLTAFEPFQRIARTGAGVPGAGLGLSLSRRLARLMGGDVSAESAPGVGSRFWLELPFDPLARVEQPSPRADAGRPLRVLTVDADTLGVAMLRASLDQLGHRMLHAHDGARGLELLRSCEVDAVVIGAPAAGEAGLGGADMVRAIRALPSLAARARIVVLVGTEIEAASLCMAAGADAVLRKPVTVGAVARALAASAQPAARAQAA